MLIKSDHPLLMGHFHSSYQAFMMSLSWRSFCVVHPALKIALKTRLIITTLAVLFAAHFCTEIIIILTLGVPVKTMIIVGVGLNHQYSN